MNLLNDILTILGSLSIIDYILYFAVITLIILVVSLIYVIQTEKEEKLIEKDSKVSEELVVNSSVKEELDLRAIVNNIDENPKPLIDMTLYEEEQEQRAIISYDELIKEVRQEIRYDKEELVDNVIPVKKISLNPISSNPSVNIIPGEPKIEVNPFVTSVKEEKSNNINLFHYEKEEAFLQALKQLNELLN